MNLLQIQNGRKAYGPKTLFEDATFAVDENEHIGVIGPNGAGKTTLFKILIGEEELDSGIFVRSRKLRVGYLAQEVTWKDTDTLVDYLSSCVTPLWNLIALGKGLGLDDEKFHVPLNSLSGGFRMRCKLLHLLGEEPNVMLLDEPTNYLDLETLLLLEKFLQNFRGTFLVISHDREFLRRTTDHTLEIEEKEITKYPGNIDDYFEEKALIREQTEKHALSIEKKKQRILDFAKRFGAKASKARQAQSRLKELGRMEKIEVRPLPVSARINIPEPERIGKRAISLEDVSFGYEDKVVLSSVTQNLIRGDKVGVVGFNGVGKSTLLKGLAKRLSPMSGKVQAGMDVRIGYYAQHVAEELDPESTVQEELEHSAHSSVTRQEVLDLAGALLFSGEAVEKKTSLLSGGEKARVALGKILLARVPVLLLDEVTNHLDFNTVEALTQALKKYQGTLVLVSHDRGFISRIATRILEIRDGKVIDYPSSYDDYVYSLEKGALAQFLSQESKPSDVQQKKTKKKKNTSSDKKKLQAELRACEKKSKLYEKKIEEIQLKMEKINSELSSQTGEEYEKSIHLLGSLPHEIVEIEQKWEDILAVKEKLQMELEKE